MPRTLSTRHGAVLAGLPEETVSSTGSFPVLKRATFPFKMMLGQKKTKQKNKNTNSKRREKRVLCCRKNLQSQVAPGGPGPCSRALHRLLGLLDHAFAEVCHFRVFYFLLVQLILSPKE